MKTGPVQHRLQGGTRSGVRWRQVYMLYVILCIVIMSDKVLVSGGGASMKTASPSWEEGTDSSDTQVTSTRPNSYSNHIT